jgi:hypothetical protein
MPSIGSAGDSYDYSLGEAVNNLYTRGLTKPRGRWKTHTMLPDVT